jgi:hypothetical protein
MGTPGNITIRDWVTAERRDLHYVVTSANFRPAVISLQQQKTRLLMLPLKPSLLGTYSVASGRAIFRSTA